MSKHTPGPWPWAYTGDGKRIVIGKGLVEGPNGYEVAEVYSDDCPREVAEANARLISLAPEMAEALRMMCDAADGLSVRGGALVGIDRVIDRTRDARALLAKLEAEG